jgi:hypothetical protein
MAITSVQAPDGTTIQVEHPEGASDEQIIQYAQQNYRAQTSTPKAEVALTQPTQGFSETQAMEAAATPQAATEPTMQRGLSTELAKSKFGRVAFPALGATLGSTLGPAGFWGGLAAGSAAAGAGEAVREVGAGEPIQPTQIAARTAENAVLPLGGKYVGGPLLKAGIRFFPGTASALQKAGIGALRQVFGNLKVPDVQAAYDAFERQKFGQLALGTAAERLPTPTLARHAPGLLEEITPYTEGWKMNPATAGLRSSIETLDKAMKATGDLTIDEAHQILRNIGPRLESALGIPKGVMSKLYGSLEQDLQAAARGGSAQAATLLEARAAAKRAAAIGDLKTTLESNIKPVEGTPLHEQVTASPIAEALPNPQSIAKPTFEQTRLGQALNAKELGGLREALSTASQLPKIRTGVPGLAERMFLYTLLGPLGYRFGSTEGIVGSAAGAEALRNWLMTPAGMQMVKRLSEATSFGRGLPSTAGGAVTSGFGGLLGQSDPLAQMLRRMSKAGNLSK